MGRQWSIRTEETGAERTRLAQRGYVIASHVVLASEVSTVARAIDRVTVRGAGTRTLLERPWCRALVRRLKARLAAAQLLRADAVAVQCTLFDKTPGRNWLVALHQDLSVPVRARVDAPSFGGWSTKESVVFVQPPVEILEQLLAVRVHIDDCGVDNGPLRVVPGTHRAGRLGAAGTAEARADRGEAVCLAKPGDAVLMRPLLLHASSKARVPSRRRVLHIVFGPPSLPDGVAWLHAVR